MIFFRPFLDLAASRSIMRSTASSLGSSPSTTAFTCSERQCAGSFSTSSSIQYSHRKIYMLPYVKWLPRRTPWTPSRRCQKSPIRRRSSRCGTIPGYWYTVFIDIIEQFAIPSSSGAYSASHDGFIVMYAFTFFFANFKMAPIGEDCVGWNPIQIKNSLNCARRDLAILRSTCHGISSAMGHCGFLYAAKH
jgi:hypothetical protein